MSNNYKYISTSIENGLTFDDLVRNLLAYKPEQWGYTEQDYNKISEEFGTTSNSLYWLPMGNYRIKNIPNSPLDSEFVNISVFDSTAGKNIILTNGSKNRYLGKVSSENDSVTWTDITNKGSDGKDLILFHVGETAPANTSMMWVDTSKLETINEISLKYYNGTSWVSYSFNGVMLQDVYDEKGLKKDPYAEVEVALEKYAGEYKIKIHNIEHYDELKNFIQNFDWNGYVKGIAMKRLKQYHIIDVLKQNFEWLK